MLTTFSSRAAATHAAFLEALDSRRTIDWSRLRVVPRSLTPWLSASSTAPAPGRAGIATSGTQGPSKVGGSCELRARLVHVLAHLCKRLRTARTGWESTQTARVMRRLIALQTSRVHQTPSSRARLEVAGDR